MFQPWHAVPHYLGFVWLVLFLRSWDCTTGFRPPLNPPNFGEYTFWNCFSHMMHSGCFSCLKKESGIIPRRLFFFLLYFSDRNTSSRATGEKSSKAVANQKNGQTWTVETTCRIFYGFRGVQGFTGWSYREL